MGLFETLTIPARQVLVAATEAAAGLESHEVDAAQPARRAARHPERRAARPRFVLPPP